MIDYGPFRFAAPPRTGSTWMLKACYTVGLGEGSKTHVHTPFIDRGAGIRVALVRHPVDWLRSYYQAIYPGIVGIHEVDEIHPRTIGKTVQSFDDFVEQYLDRCPGAIGRMLTSYAADSCIRTEDLPWGAIELFVAIGIKEQIAKAVTDLGKQNNTKHPLIIDPQLRRRITAAEAETMELYEYT